MKFSNLSYFYDEETGLYYLNSRYYNPQWGRFISADNLFDTGNLLGANLYAYCANNPVNLSDSTGHWFGIDDVIAGGIGALAGVTSLFLCDLVNSAFSGEWQFSNWQAYVGAAAGGALGGITTLYLGPVAGGIIGTGYSTLLEQTLENITGETPRSTEEIVVNAFFDAGIGGIVAAVAPFDVPGITSGPGNMQENFTSALYSVGNGSGFSFAAARDGFVSSVVESLPSDLMLNINFGNVFSFEKSTYPILLWCLE